MKIIDISFDADLRNKTLTVGADSEFCEEDTIKFTGYTRRVKDIFGKVKEQAQFYVLTKKYSFWKKGEYKIIEKGPYWKKTPFKV